MARDFLSHNVIEVSNVPVDTTGAARAWEPKPLEDAAAFPLLSALQHQINALTEQLEAITEWLLLLETSQTARPTAHSGKK